MRQRGRPSTPRSKTAVDDQQQTPTPCPNVSQQRSGLCTIGILDDDWWMAEGLLVSTERPVDRRCCQRTLFLGCSVLLSNPNIGGKMLIRATSHMVHLAIRHQHSSCYRPMLLKIRERSFVSSTSTRRVHSSAWSHSLIFHA